MGERPSRAEAERAVATLLAYIGEDPARPALRETPQRVIAAFEEYFAGYGRDPRAVLGDPLPCAAARGQLVVARQIAFASHCEHHIAPFFGTATVAFVARERLVGIGHIAELVEVLARRLQIQERLTQEIARVLEEVLEPEGLLVVLEATHSCMALRGPQQREARIRTVYASGCLAGERRRWVVEGIAE